MAFWHYPDGTPSPPFKGRFDWSHLTIPIVMLVVFVILLINDCRERIDSILRKYFR